MRIRPDISLPFLLFSLLAACSTPAYDDQTDKLALQLQTDVETELTTLLTLGEEIQDVSQDTDPTSKAALTKYQAAANWTANMAAYDKIEVDLLVLRPRVAAESNWGTSSVLQSIDLLSANLVDSANSMRGLHKRDGILRLDEIQDIKGVVEPQLDALIAVEAQLKTAQPSKSTTSTTKSSG